MYYDAAITNCVPFPLNDRRNIKCPYNLGNSLVSGKISRGNLFRPVFVLFISMEFNVEYEEMTENHLIIKTWYNTRME